MNTRSQLFRERLGRYLTRLEQRPWAVYLTSFLLCALLFTALQIATTLVLPPKRNAPLIPTAPALFLLNTLVVFALFSLLFALSNRWIFSVGLTLFAAVAFAAFSLYKNRILGVPFVPSDVYMLPQGIEMRSVLFTFAHWHLLLYLLSFPAAAAALFFAFRLRRPRVALALRALALSCALAVVGWLFAYGWFPKSAVTRFYPIPEVLWNKAMDYNSNGLFLMFVIDAARMLRPVPQPAGYSREAIARIARECDTQTTSTAAAAPPAANVILFLAESFFDVESLPIKTSGDPSPFFHSLRREGVAGDFLVPTYGGLTTRTEFEILTGLSMAFMPQIVDPYASNLNLNRKLPALPAFFARRRYQTIAIHAFAPLGECRQVYPLLGIQRYIGSNEFRKSRNRGPYVSDESLVDKIIEVADQSARKSAPFFILADSMGTHGAYDKSWVTNERLDVLTTMSQASHTILKTYINAVADMDTALRRLVDHFRGAQSRTLIVIFGDHVPPLGDNFMVYKELGFYRQGSEEMEIRVHTTPLAAWANFPLPARPIARRATTLYSYVIQAAGLPLDEYGRFNDHLARSLTPANKITPDVERDYRLVQYDLFHGGRYLMGGFR